MKDIDGEKLIKFNKQKVELAFESKRIPAKGYNAIARKKGKGKGKGRIVPCAHIDTKKNTPGALDNATNVAVLMALAEQIRDYKGANDIEIIAFNGEDYYSVPGQMLYFNQNNRDLENIKMAINIDEAGHKDSKTAVSFYNLLDSQKERIMRNFSKHSTIVEGEKWCEGDHSMFLQKGVPCIAVTSSNMRVVMNILSGGD